MIITTTNVIEGYKIEKYIGLQSARIVVGAGMFSEFFAGFTDVFGGRSSKFEARLKELNDYVIDELKKSAKLKGANAIIGISLDIDEISGKNTQMFMISGIGTAVKLKQLGGETIEEQIPETLTGMCIRKKIIGNDLISELHKTKSIESFNNVIQNLLNEGIDIPLEVLIDAISNLSIFKEARLNIDKQLDKTILQDYLSLYESEQVSKEIKNAIIKSNKLPGIILEIFEVYGDLDFKQVIELIQRLPVYLWSRSIFPILKKYKKVYLKEDIQHIKVICEMLRNLKENDMKKGLFNKDYYMCICGKKFSPNDSVCGCERDKYGLTHNEREQREEIVSFLQKQMEIIKLNLGG